MRNEKRKKMDKSIRKEKKNIIKTMKKVTGGSFDSILLYEMKKGIYC